MNTAKVLQGMGAAWNFAQMDDFWSRYQALTPWGKDEADARIVMDDRALLESRYDDIDLAMAFIASKASESSVVDRVSYHLKRMPRIPLDTKESYELVELFQIKKFMANYRGLYATLEADLAGAFGLRPLEQGGAGEALARELDRGGSDPETFYVADSYDEGLAAARAVIAAADAAVAQEKIRAEAEARLSHGLSFDGRDFLVVPRETVRAMAGGRYSIDPYDDTRYIVRLLPSPAALEAMADRERGLGDERRAEARVLARLSLLVAEAMPELEAAVLAVLRWDRARAGAALALECDMRRPKLDAGSLCFKAARFVPCAEECAAMGLAYSPLTAEFNAGAVVLFGSNMGGKTVVLKTIVFFQLLAQAGLFVPAGRYETRVFSRIEYVGELAGERLAGLSGFGLEVWRLMAASAGRVAAPVEAGITPAAGAGPGAAETANGSAAPDATATGPTLVVFDELARTTGSHEAEALLSAVVESYAAGGDDRAFFATHFRGVARIAGAEYRRMKGLDKESAAADLGAARPVRAEVRSVSGAFGQTETLTRRLAGINRHMRYEVMDDDGSGSESDALAIASFLGMDEALVKRATEFFNGSARF